MKRLATTALLVAASWGCHSGSAPTAGSAPADVSTGRAASAAPEQPAGAPRVADAPVVKTTSLDSMVASRKLIRTGEISIVVASYEKAAQEATRLAESLGGYVADSHASRSPTGKERGSLTLRIPADRFGESVTGIKGLGTVRSQSVSAQDVTKTYTDLETRLLVKRDTANRLREILRKRTADLADILQVERELARITEEIEQLEGERRFYDQQVALSTLKLELEEPGADATKSALAPLREALGDFLRILSGSASGIVYLTAVLVPWLLLAWGLGAVITRMIRSRRKTNS
jgi:hypothetical protein